MQSSKVLIEVNGLVVQWLVRWTCSTPGRRIAWANRSHVTSASEVTTVRRYRKLFNLKFNLIYIPSIT